MSNVGNVVAPFLTNVSTGNIVIDYNYYNFILPRQQIPILKY